MGTRRIDAPQFEIAPILEYLGFEDVPRTTSGHRKVLCRFHGERDPSASVGRYSFVCFGCGRTGDAIKLLREEEDLTYAEAVARCEEITGGEGHANTNRGAAGGSSSSGWAVPQSSDWGS